MGMRQFSNEPTIILTEEESVQHLHNAVRQNEDPLVEFMAMRDTSNLFRVNRNIRPHGISYVQMAPRASLN